MQAFTRANPFLDEIIEILQQHLERHHGDIDKARSYLSSSDNEWIDGEVLHCINEPRYFLSNYYAIKTEDKGFQGLYPFWDSQEILHDEFRRMEREFGRVMAIINKARQMGGSTYVGGEVFHKTIFNEHINTLVVAQDAKQSRYIFDMYIAALDFLPWWMRPRVRYAEAGEFIDFDEKDEQLRSIRPGLKTRIYVDNGNKPTGAGRGKTFKYGHLDELAFWKEPEQLTEAVFPTMNAPGGFYVMISTPRGRNTPWHNLWRNAEKGKIAWNPIYIPFYRREKTYSLPLRKDEKFIPTEEEQGIRQQVLTKENHFIKDEVFNWRRKTVEAFMSTHGDDKKFSQEYSSNAEESFQASATTAFPRGIINKLQKRCIEPKWVGEIVYDFKADRPVAHLKELKDGEEADYPETFNRFHVWERPQVGESYCVGVDTSLGNEGGDYSCACVIKTSMGSHDVVVAIWHGLMDPENLAEVVLALCYMYNEALAAIEINNMGLVTNNALVRKFEYENIYRYKHLDKLSKWQTDYIGFLANEKTSMAIMSKLSKSLIEDTIIIPCHWMMDEFNDFTEDGAEGDGAHDDYMDALMIALYCGHENEFKQMREGTQKLPAESNANLFEIKDRFGSIVGSTNSQKEAEAIAKRNFGSFTERTSGAKAFIVLNGKKREVPSDFQNSDWSPVHDGDGMARQMYEDGWEPEDISPEAIAEAEAMVELVQESPDAWMYT